ncbi:hypothetical protein HZA99_01800 [Candidatus Woesearchaeota archaeon]|nr:hypothetical protein [Candidatus Woesearchaeota archaeon]
MFRRIFCSRKAETEMLSTITKIVLLCIILIPLFVLGYKLVNVFIPKTDEATLKNFDQLVATIQTMEQGTSVSSYPLYLKAGYTVVGYPSAVDSSDKNAISGTCTGITDIHENKKPEKCGAGNEGCICLCQTTSAFADLCQDNDKVAKCYGKEELGSDISFVGGIYTDGSGQCDFALIYGTGSPITISLLKGLQSSADKDAKTAEVVHLCTKECGTETNTAVATAQTTSPTSSST